MILTCGPCCRAAWRHLQQKARDSDNMGLTKEQKTELVSKFGRNEADTGSAEVQIAMLTTRIQYLTDHLIAHKQDQSSRRGLLKLVGQRRRHLKYLSQTNPEAYREILAKLGLRR
jgi:small subunit ribosomal protein S15